jgi:hypothetical protein
VTSSSLTVTRCSAMSFKLVQVLWLQDQCQLIKTSVYGKGESTSVLTGFVAFAKSETNVVLDIASNE